MGSGSQVVVLRLLGCGFNPQPGHTKTVKMVPIVSLLGTSGDDESNAETSFASFCM